MSLSDTIKPPTWQARNLYFTNRLAGQYAPPAVIVRTISVSSTKRNIACATQSGLLSVLGLALRGTLAWLLPRQADVLEAVIRYRIVANSAKQLRSAQ